MGLTLTPEAAARRDALDPELVGAAHAIGVGLSSQLHRLRPGAAAGDATLTHLTLDGDGDADPLSLAACVAAHDAYLRRRDDGSTLSAGALALARLLVWAQRAALLGPAPRIAWIGPEARRPTDIPGTALTAECALQADGTRRRARAVAIITPG